MGTFVVVGWLDGLTEGDEEGLIEVDGWDEGVAMNIISAVH